MEMVRERPIEPSAVEHTSGTAHDPGADSAGVEDLIGRLRDAGVAQGRAEAEAIVSAARQEAAGIVAAARREAEAVVAAARTEDARLKVATEDALRLASRDAILGLESGLIDHLRRMVRWLVKGALEDPGFLQRLILEVAGRTVPREGELRVLLPEALVSLDDLMKHPEEARAGTLMGFVASMGRGLLREGVTLGTSDEIEAGVRIQVVGEDAHVELTDDAIGELLLQHMLPRFRALLRGAVVSEQASREAPEERKEAAIH